MNIQYIIVFLMIVGAFAYVGNMFWKKARPAKKGCDSDCGCGKA